MIAILLNSLSSSSPLLDGSSSNGTQSEGIPLCVTSEPMAKPSCDLPTSVTSTVAPAIRSSSSDLLNVPVSVSPKKQVVHTDQEACRSFVTNQVSEIDSEQQAPYFTVEEELKYANRYEEGYDLFDAHYQAGYKLTTQRMLT